MTSKHWFLILLLSLSILLVLIVINITTLTERKERWLRAEIEKSLPIRSPRNDIDYFLTSRKIKHDHYPTFVFGYIQDIPTGVWCIKGHLQVTFYLDNAEQLSSYETQTEYTGPF